MLTGPTPTGAHASSRYSPLTASAESALHSVSSVSAVDPLCQSPVVRLVPQSSFMALIVKSVAAPSALTWRKMLALSSSYSSAP